MNEVLHVFVDEYGDSNLDISKKGVTERYIVTAFCVVAPKLELAKTKLEIIREKFFQKGEMKSSSVASNDGKRLALLKRINEVDAFVVAFCADKSRMSRDSGLQYKKTSIKFFAMKLYERLTHPARDLVVIADRHGHPAFESEFRAYLQKKFPNDLFRSATFSVADSKNEVLLQAADVYAGSLARLYDSGKKSDRLDELKAIVRDKVSVTFWPEGRQQPAARSAPEDGDDLDNRVKNYCTHLARSYIESHSTDGDLEDLARAEFLNILLSHQAWSDESEFIATKVLLTEIGRRLSEKFSEHKFRSSVVAKLRDSNVIIASSSRGYKLPSSLADIREFASFANTIIPPMVSRIEKANRGLRDATMGAADFLNEDEFRQLKKLVDALEVGT